MQKHTYEALHQTFSHTDGMFEQSSLQGSSRQTVDFVTQVLLSVCRVYVRFRTLP